MVCTPLTPVACIYIIDSHCTLVRVIPPRSYMCRVRERRTQCVYGMSLLHRSNSTGFVTQGKGRVFVPLIGSTTATGIEPWVVATEQTSLPEIVDPTPQRPYLAYGTTVANLGANTFFTAWRRRGCHFSLPLLASLPETPTRSLSGAKERPPFRSDVPAAEPKLVCGSLSILPRFTKINPSIISLRGTTTL